jgi:hypothetical protein
MAHQRSDGGSGALDCRVDGTDAIGGGGSGGLE